MKLNDIESSRVLAGRALAITRFYPNGARLAPKQEHVISNNGTPFGVIQIRSIRPIKSEDYISNPKLLKGEGWSDISSWKKNLKRNKFEEGDSLYRITFNVLRFREGAKLE